MFLLQALYWYLEYKGEQVLTDACNLWRNITQKAAWLIIPTQCAAEVKQMGVWECKKGDPTDLGNQGGFCAAGTFTLRTVGFRGWSQIKIWEKTSRWSLEVLPKRTACEKTPSQKRGGCFWGWKEDSFTWNLERSTPLHQSWDVRVGIVPHSAF